MTNKYIWFITFYATLKS